jgi:hypothetical protein
MSVTLKAKRFVAGALSFACVALLCGCSSFNRAWERAGHEAPTAGSMAGRWEGHWNSEKTGHHGKLLCILSQETNGVYNARFKATYMKIMKASYRVKLDAERTNNGWHFHGREDLGWLFGGIYEYEGNADATNFYSTYHCKWDHGMFEMKRVQ